MSGRPYETEPFEDQEALMKLSIIIVNWNSKDYLRLCLASIAKYAAGLPLQIIVVDGGSFDGCGEMLAAGFPDVEFVQSQENIGFGKSNNLGFGRVTGDLVLLLNPDSEVLPGTINELVEILASHPDAGMVGARLLNSDGSFQESSVHPLPTPLGTAIDSDVLRRWWWRKARISADGRPIVVDAVSGACILMRTKVFRQIGGFNPRYFMYAEDMDLCLKIKRSGLRVYHAPRAEVLHHGGGSSRTCFSKFSTVMTREAVNLFMEINHGMLTVKLYRQLIGLSAVVRLSLLIPVWIMTPGQRRHARRASISRWWVVLRWLAGLEDWVKPYFLTPTASSHGTTAI